MELQGERRRPREEKKVVHGEEGRRNGVKISEGMSFI